MRNKIINLDSLKDKYNEFLTELFWLVSGMIYKYPGIMSKIFIKD